ncbi:unnamed protein product [Orchesella dallaii]|uniref:Odorant receptor n=1 Tax=Orchesella dallaii TaxID=48710 RepID=A0ABP1S792_9HEXA
MISSRFFAIFHVQILLGNLFWGTPFKWDRKTCTLFVTKKAYLRYCFSVTILVLITSFWVFQVIRYKLLEKTADMSYAFTYALMICGILDIFAASPTLRHAQYLASFFNNFTQIFEKLRREYMPNFEPNVDCTNWFFDFIIFSSTFSGPFCGLVIASHYFIYPQWPLYLTSLLPSDNLTFPYLISFGIFYFWFLQMIWAILLLDFVIIVTVVRYGWLLTNEFHFGEQHGNKKYKTGPAFRKQENVQRNLRVLQILHLNALEIYSGVIIPLQTVVTNLVIFCNFVIIRYWEILTVLDISMLLIWIVLGNSLAVVGLTCCAMLYQRSVKLKKSLRCHDWKTKAGNKLMAKFIKSVIPFRFGYGKMYVIRKKSVLKFL